MKKHNALMRASGILLVLTLGTSCFVGGTFAKYTTSNNATDTARVAKWGVKVIADGDKAFKTTYDTNDVIAAGEGIATAVQSTVNVVAPGTQGKFGGITIDGEPEVAVSVTTTATVELGENADWTVSEQVYCPLIFKVGNTVIDGLKYDDIGSLESAIATEIQNATTKKYEAGESIKDIEVEYEWAWLFTEDDAGKTWSSGGKIEHVADAAEQQDTLDTLLGDAAADDNAPDINITVTTTVTQID